MHGHCIDVKDKTDKNDIQVCQIEAQIYHYLQYAKKHKEEVALNALLYKDMNEPKHVCLVQSKRNPPISEFEDVCEQAYIEELNTYNDLDQEFN